MRWPPSAGGGRGWASRKATRSEAPTGRGDWGKDPGCKARTGRGSLVGLFEGRRQLILYRFFYEPGVSGWPERGCVGWSVVADQVANLAHLNARDTTYARISRAPQRDIQRLQARMGWQGAWYTITD